MKHGSHHGGAGSPYGGKAVRRGALAYLGGRAASAILTFTAFALAARTLPLAEYGRYAAALALAELAILLSTGGMEWVVTRILPEARVNAGGRATVRLALRLCALEGVQMVAAGVLLVAGAPLLGDLLQLGAGDTLFHLAGALMVIEGWGRLFRDQMLGTLMAQRAGQVAQAMRSGTLMLQLLLVWHEGRALDAIAMMRLELAAAAAGAITGALLLARTLYLLLPLPPADPAWRAPPRGDLARLAWNNHASYLLAMLYGPHVLTMLVARMLGAEAVAVFGFARAFTDQVRRYLPTDLLLPVLRPAMIAFYASGHSFEALSERLGLWLKASLLVLFPLLLFFTAFGPQGMQVLGGARFVQAWPVVLVMLCGTATAGWRRMLELGCNAVMAPDICARATVALVVVPPLLALVLHVSGSLLPAVALVVIAECVFCWRVIRSLEKRGYMGHWDGQGGLRVLAAWGVTGGVLILVQTVAVIPLPLALLACALMSALALRIALPLNAAEGRLLAGWNGHLARLVGSRPEANAGVDAQGGAA